MKHKKFNLKSTVLFNYNQTNQKVKNFEDPTLTLATVTATQIIFNR